MPHRGNPNQPSRGPTLDTRAGPRPTHHSRTFQDTSTQEGRTKPPTRTHSLKERARRRCTDAHARPHPPRRHGRVHIGTPIHGPCFSGHIDSQGCCQCPADMPSRGSEIGQYCTNPTTGGPRPSTLPEPPDSAPHPHQTSPSTNRLADSSRPPNPDPPTQSAETRTPHTPRHPRTLGGNDLDIPTLPNRTHPTTGLPFSVVGSHTTTQPRHTAT